MNNTTRNMVIGAVSNNGTIETVRAIDVISGLLGLSGIFFNSLLLTLYRINPLLRKDARRLQVALGMADALMGFGSVLMAIDGFRIQFINSWYTAYYCQLIAMARFLGDTVSVTITLAMALERFVAISQPLMYRSMNKKMFANILIASSFSICVVVYGICFYDMDNTKKPSACLGNAVRAAILKPLLSYFNCTVGTLVVVLYFMIVATIRIQIRDVSLNINIDGSNDSVMKKEIEASRTVMFIVLACIGFYIVPNIVITILNLAGLPSSQYGIYVTTFAMCNATFNFFLYVWQDAKVRKTLIDAVRSKLPKVGPTSS